MIGGGPAGAGRGEMCCLIMDLLDEDSISASRVGRLSLLRIARSKPASTKVSFQTERIVGDGLGSAGATTVGLSTESSSSSEITTCAHSFCRAQ